MWKREDLANYQVLGSNLQATMAGFGSFTLIASKFLLEEGIGTPDDTGLAQLVAEQWYPLDRWLRAFEKIHAEFGSFTLRQVGIYVPKNSKIPPQMKDIYTVLQFLDVGYHFNHGINGEPMFNMATGEMKEGIGHYKYIGYPPGTKKVSVEVDGPYPCPFDEGLVTAASQLFMPTAVAMHDKISCRMRGGASCTYHVTWK